MYNFSDFNTTACQFLASNVNEVIVPTEGQKNMLIELYGHPADVYYRRVSYKNSTYIIYSEALNKDIVLPSEGVTYITKGILCDIIDATCCESTPDTYFGADSQLSALWEPIYTIIFNEKNSAIYIRVAY